jgi:hypothetical protein
VKRIWLFARVANLDLMEHRNGEARKAGKLLGAHASQVSNRNYIELQLTRAR